VSSEPVEGTFGNWKKPSSPGLFGLGQRATMAGAVCMVVAMVVMLTAGMLVGIVAVVVSAAVIAAFGIHDRDGLSVADKIGEHMGYAQTMSRGGHIHRGGPLGTGNFGLPGVGAELSVMEGQDVSGASFVMVVRTNRRRVSVVFGCEPGGFGSADQDERIAAVASWGSWLNRLGEDTDIVGVQVVVQTAPDTGERLRVAVETQIDPDAPPLARRVLAEIVGSTPARAAQVSTWVVVTWKTNSLGRKAGDAASLADMLAPRLGGLVGLLRNACMGQVWLLDGGELAEAVRTAYDPASRSLFDKARAEGNPIGLSWKDAGPSVATAAYDWYRHDSAASQTWTAVGAPQGIVTANVLTRLLAPGQVPMKRVTLLYTPVEAGAAQKMVDDDVRAASASRGTKRGADVTSTFAYQQANHTAMEVAAGAGLVFFGMIVTATTDDLSERRQLGETMKSLGGTARIRLRLAYGCQDAGFVASLPLGVYLADELTGAKAVLK